MRILKTIFFLLVMLNGLKSQFITHGPIVGGVTDNKARIFLRTETSRNFILELDIDSLFTSPLIFNNNTIADLDSSSITELFDLTPNTKYYYRAKFNNIIDTKRGSFTTFPIEGQAANFTFVTGSCQETSNMKVYDVIPTYNPLFMLHLGDFTYPSYQLPNSYPSQWFTIPWSYRKRYEESVMKDKLFPYTPLVYMPDDDDNFGASRTNHVRSGYSGSGSSAVNYFIIDTILPVERENCLRGYRTFFPGYETVDTTEGHYHSYKVANCEFFVLDTRSMADPHSNAYRVDTATNRWVFDPPQNHSIIGLNQMNWLLNGLSNSTADWKFIVSGVPFNPKIRNIIEAGLLIQNIVFTIAGETGTGFRLSTSFAGYWAGYPSDIQNLTSHINSNGIDGVLLISGDTHHNVIDDGTNSVYPELNASGLSVSTTELAYQIAQYAPIFGQPSVVDSLWNGGGNGLNNTNFLNGFGKVDVYGQDSVRYCVVDENNLNLSCITIYSDGSVFNPSSIEKLQVLGNNNKINLNIYPNPSKGDFNVSIFSHVMVDDFELEVYELNGKVMIKKNIQAINNIESHYQFQLPENAPSSSYILVMKNNKGEILAAKTFQKK